MEQTLGGRMKGYEYVTRNYLTNRIPVIIRLDGKAFHKFTKGFDKPCDEVFATAMKETTKELCKQVQSVILGYTQSDEISLVMMNTSNKASELWFNNNLSKIISVSASIATVEFNKAFTQALIKQERFIDKAKMEMYKSKLFTATFDSRAFNLPQEEINNYLIWRQRDCQKNAVNSAARVMFSHSQLQNLNQQQLKEKMLQEKDINFDTFFNKDFKNGITFIKKDKERIGTDNLGNSYKATSKQWVPTNRLFEIDYEFFTQYILENRG